LYEITTLLAIPYIASYAQATEAKSYCHHVSATYSSEPATYKHIPSEQATVLEVVLNNDICHCIKHKLDVVGVCSTREVSVYLFLVLPFVQILKLQLDIRCSFFVSVRTLKIQFVSIKSIP
jgi:hypothetical protein